MNRNFNCELILIDKVLRKFMEDSLTVSEHRLVSWDILVSVFGNVNSIKKKISSDLHNWGSVTDVEWYSHEI